MSTCCCAYYTAASPLAANTYSTQLHIQLEMYDTIIILETAGSNGPQLPIVSERTQADK